METHGEKLVASLLNKLPKGKYYVFQEPKIASMNSAYQHADFIVVSAQLGVIVIEVKDWKKIQSIKQKTFIVKHPDGRDEEEKNPLFTAKEYALNLADRFRKRKELLRKYDGRELLMFPWMYAAILINLESKIIRECEERGIWNKGEVVGKDDLIEARFEQALLKIPSPWKLKTPLNADILDIIRGIIQPELIVTNTEGHDVGTITVPQERLITEPLKLKNEELPKQQSLIDEDFLTTEAKQTSESTSIRLVRGVAGSGKSLVLARRARYLAETYPNLNILVMAFNVDLVADLKRKIANTDNINVNNFHKICAQILGDEWRKPIETEGWLNNRFPNLIQEKELNPTFVAQEIEWRKELGIYDNLDYLEVSREGRGTALSRSKREIINTIFSQYLAHQIQTSNIDWSDVPHRVLEKMKSDPNLFQQFDAILIDEAQDFAPSWITIALKLLKSGGSIFICDDPTQSLFRSFSWKQKGVEVVGRTRILRIPFRCTREITVAAYSLIEADNSLNTSEEIIKPDLETYELISGELPKLTKYLNSDQEVIGVTKTALQLVNSGISPQNIAILCHSKRIVKNWAHLRTKGYYVESFAKMKGLEFTAVFIPHVHDSYNSVNLKDDTEITEKRQQLFTAMTRARQNLVLSYSDELPLQLLALEDYVIREDLTGFKPEKLSPT